MAACSPYSWAKAHLVEPDFGKPTPMTGTEYGGDGEEDATWVLPLRPVTNWIDALEALLGASTGRSAMERACGASRTGASMQRL